jgi:molybdopterin-containing oxidoreductase family membrane subunit
MILPDLGRPDNMLNMLLYPNLNSMLPLDFLVLSLYALISAIYTYVQIRPDLAKTGITIPLIGTIMKQDIGEDELSEMRRRSDRHARLLAPIGLIFAILIHTVTAWVLATQLSRPWWYGGLLAPTFIAAALASGSVIVVLTSLATMGHRPRLTVSYGLLAKISAVSTITLLFLYYNDFVVRFWWSQGAEFETLALVLSDYLALHAAEAILMLTGVALLVAWWRNPKALTIGSLSIMVGILAHRLLLIPPAYNFNPFQLSVISAGEVLDWTYPIAVGEVRGDLLNSQSIFVTG